MGISGLISFVDHACRQAHLSEFSGQVIAVDAYNWIYRGSTSCAVRLAEIGILDGTCFATNDVVNNAISPIVTYVVRRVDTLKQFNITPILVFDGRDLPLKSKVDEKRRSLKQCNLNKIKAAVDSASSSTSRQWNENEIRDACRRAFEVNYIIVRQVIVALRSISCPYVVAPYEADAQLAYFCKYNIANAVLTEDSDLIAYGCNTILFKFDQTTCMCQRYDFSLLCKSKSYSALFNSCHNRKFISDRIRWMCILSGCDYFEGIPGIGLKKAHAILKKTRKCELVDVLQHIRTCLTHAKIPNNFYQRFIEADHMFKHQFIFDIVSSQLCPLNCIDSENNNPLEPVSTVNLAHVQRHTTQLPFSNEEALLQALGCYNYETMQIHKDDENIDVDALKVQMWNQVVSNFSSSKSYDSCASSHSYSQATNNMLKRKSTLIVDDMTTDMARITRPKTIPLPSCSSESALNAADIDRKIIKQYATNPPAEQNMQRENIISMTTTTQENDCRLRKCLESVASATLATQYLPNSVTALYSPYFAPSKSHENTLLQKCNTPLKNSSSALDVNVLASDSSACKLNNLQDQFISENQNVDQDVNNIPSIFDSIENTENNKDFKKLISKGDHSLKDHYSFYTGPNSIPLKLRRTDVHENNKTFDSCQSNFFCKSPTKCNEEGVTVCTQVNSNKRQNDSQNSNTSSRSNVSLTSRCRKVGLSRNLSLPVKQKNKTLNKCQSITDFFKSISVPGDKDLESTDNHHCTDKSRSKIVNVLIN